MPSVTISGGAGEVVSLPFNSGLNALYAQTLADEASQAVSNGTLRVVDYTGGMLPPPVAGIEDEVVINAAGPLTLPPVRPTRHSSAKQWQTSFIMESRRSDGQAGAVREALSEDRI